MCCKAAVVAGEAVAGVSTERERAVEGIGSGMCVARNMW